MPLIEVRDVEKTYRLGLVEIPALRGVSFDVDGQELVALMGPSGSGKTTLLSILGCLEAPSRGSYRLAEREIVCTDHDRYAGVRSEMIGFVFQLFNLVPVLTARENVELPMLWHPRPAPAAERRKRATELLEAVGLGGLSDRRPAELSGGQQQRVALARALANRPRVVLADEPTANLDTQTADQVLDVMQSLWRDEGTTFILSTHDPRILERTTRVLRMVDGRIISDDEAAGPSDGVVTAAVPPEPGRAC